MPSTDLFTADTNISALGSAAAVSGFNTFVDLSHFNTNVDLAAAQKAGLAGIIHKATQGVKYVDPTYKDRRATAKELELFWGAYHFGNNDSVSKQIDNFLGAIGDESSGVVPCLDWEPDSTRGEDTMSLEKAVEFVKKIHAALGVWPMIYGGYWMIDQLKGKTVPEFSNCPLWQGYYKQPLKIPESVWSTWALWQYTDGELGPMPHKFPGIDCQVDRDTFNGKDINDVAIFWKKHQTP